MEDCLKRVLSAPTKPNSKLEGRLKSPEKIRQKKSTSAI